MQKPGFTGATLALAAAMAATRAASAAFLALSKFSMSTACCKFLTGSGTDIDDNFNSENVEESVTGFECQMNALPFPEGDCPSCASADESSVQGTLGSIPFGIFGLHVK